MEVLAHYHIYHSFPIDFFIDEEAVRAMPIFYHLRPQLLLLNLFKSDACLLDHFFEEVK